MSPLPKNRADWPQCFTFAGVETDDAAGEAHLLYTYESGPSFRETIAFNAPLPAPGSPLRPGLDAALEALALVAGVSYYKAFLPPRISFEGLSPDADQRLFFQNLYVDGLGEFGVRNGVRIDGRVDFDVAGGSSRRPAPTGAPQRRRSAVLIGGGKDSLVSTEALKSAGEALVLFAVNPKRPILECAAASGLPFIRVERHLDPKLFELNEAGALNGHVPITAIVSFIAIASAFVHGFDAVILSNERSANQGNLVRDGREINHQFSKTAGVEQGIADYVARHIHPRLAYFSLLRPLSEAHIAQLMARTETYDGAFTSCNRAFQLRPKAPPARWCRDCPKCRFTFLILATAMKRERLEAIFGGNMLEDESQREGFEELMGLSGHKPWECVGEIAESGAALLLLAERPEWRETPIVRALAPRLAALIPDVHAIWTDLLTPSPDHHLPARYEDMLNAYLAGR
ncbi:MAG: hypothetical protein JWL93_2272 [Hyphomicrobiales bacterium]|jgi:hypothetical protein|nr:hypothetical protein [Hyphomicrobiales bacterium]